MRRALTNIKTLLTICCLLATIIGSFVAIVAMATFSILAQAFVKYGLPAMIIVFVVVYCCRYLGLFH